MFLVQWSQLIGYGKWCSLWQHAHIISTGRPKLGYFETWPVFSLPTQWKKVFETVERKKLKIQKNSLFSEFDDVTVKTFYFMFRPSKPLIEVGTGDFKGKYGSPLQNIRTRRGSVSTSLRTADAFPVVASLPRSDDRKCVCGSQAT